ncbi:MAG: curli production assembly protein CsgG [Bacteroidetes bacterium]|nr:MAG: curli production assembly protein CsgG [Bacteroidota bacterium]
MLRLTYLFLPLLLLGGCNAYLHQPLSPSTARIGEETAVTPVLRQLPAPREPIYVAVYKFRDQTGQYKPAELGANWSTAVTQGGTSILLKALERSGWFIPVERENVSNLLNERKIIRNSRIQYSSGGQPQGPVLPPLLFAGIILEGGIISYDANIMTGGLGARYFGAGGSAKYRQDRVSVYLRAISTNNGKVLKTVYTSRTILSQAVDVGLFRFVSFQRLLEAETGFTYNEPSEIAITEAIEKAVQALVLEGIEERLWTSDTTATSRAEAERALALYKSERSQMAEINYLGRTRTPLNAIASTSFGVSQLQFRGDLPGYGGSQLVDLGFSGEIRPWLGTGLTVSYGSLMPHSSQQLRLLAFSWTNRVRLLPENRFSPLLLGQLGLIRLNNNSELVPPNLNQYSAQLAFGAEYRINDVLSLEVSGGYTHLFRDNLDSQISGRYNDMYWQGRLGLRYYLQAPKN